jgi:hypothetical protein
MRSSALMLILLSILAPRLGAQEVAPRLSGTWKAETPDGPRDVTIRSDSSASYGDETVRWRAVGDSLHIAFGDEWVVYAFNLRGARLTLSGGDLDQPITLRRTGPPRPRPAGVPVPPAPPAAQRAPGLAGPVAPRGGSGRGCLLSDRTAATASFRDPRCGPRDAVA